MTKKKIVGGRSSSRPALAKVEQTGLSKDVLRDEGVRRLDALAKQARAAALAPATAQTAKMLKTVADFARAQQIWAAKQKLGKDVEDYAFAIKTEALAELGHVMEDMPKATGTRGNLAGPAGGRISSGRSTRRFAVSRLSKSRTSSSPVPPA